jgi:hypothetical protein
MCCWQLAQSLHAGNGQPTAAAAVVAAVAVATVIFHLFISDLQNNVYSLFAQPVYNLSTT